MSNALAIVETITAVEFFKPGASDDILTKLENEARAKAATLDKSIPEDREEMRSLAFKLGKAKNRLDDAGKGLVAEDTARIKRINAERGIVWDRVEGLQKEVRQPLTDWENAEKDRVAAHEERLRELEATEREAPTRWQELSLEAMHDRIVEIVSDTRDWEEFTKRGIYAQNAAVAAIKVAIDKREKYEAEQAELTRLRAESAEREQKERDERVAAGARQKAEQAAEAERKRIENEKFQAEARAKEAEARERAALEKADADRLAAIEWEKKRIAQAEADRIAAEERHAREKEAAIGAERQRQEAEAKRLKEEAEARERNKQHAAKINREVRDALMAACPHTLTADFTEQLATTLTTAIAKGLIPHVKVAY